MKNFINKIIYSDYIFFYGPLPAISDMKHNFLNAILIFIVTTINVRFILFKIIQFITYNVNTYKEIIRYL